jgi:hypothetical protein
VAPAALVLGSKRNGATVSVDGEPLSLGPLAQRLASTAGRHRLVFTGEGGRRCEVDVELVANQQRSFLLQPDGSIAELAGRESRAIPCR